MLDPYDVASFGPAMRALNPRQRKFVMVITAPGVMGKKCSAREAAMLAGYSPKSINSQGSMLNRDPKVQAAIREFTATTLVDKGTFIPGGLAALSQLEEALHDRANPNNFQAAKFFLDQVWPAPKPGVVITETVEDARQTDAEMAAWVKELGISYEKTWEHFGWKVAALAFPERKGELPATRPLDKSSRD